MTRADSRSVSRRTSESTAPVPRIQEKVAVVMSSERFSATLSDVAASPDHAIIAAAEASQTLADRRIASGRISSMAWARPEYDKTAVNQSARLLVRAYSGNAIEADIDYQDWIHALEVINNWRAIHGHPLNTFQMNLRRSAARVDHDCLVAQRTKRLSSIAAKLVRFPKMKLTQMQDIGGCRAVVDSVKHVQRLADFYQSESRIKHPIQTVDDYIATPQTSGYRGIHLVFRYQSDKESPSVFNGLKIEMQLRSQFQHAWATAVETVGTFIRHALKSSIGPDEWRRFFALMGSAIAMREGTVIVPETPVGRGELLDELDYYSGALNVIRRLEAYGNALRLVEQDSAKAKDAHWYLLQLDPEANELNVTGFEFGQLAEAQRQYLEAEKRVKQNPETDAVLVSVESLASLQKAYPNYFADTRVFSALLQQALNGDVFDIATT
jgi:ppGpp synthetase/RelA/SpoT-type nucleotidyltranferase